MNKEEIQKIVHEYIKDNLFIYLGKEDYYGDAKVTLYVELNKDIIYKDYIIVR